MTPTRDHSSFGPQIDTGIGSPLAPRPEIWAYGGLANTPASDTGVGSPLARRPDTLDSGNAFIPPLWI